MVPRGRPPGTVARPAGGGRAGDLMAGRMLAALILSGRLCAPVVAADRCPTAADMPRGITLHRGNSTLRVRALGPHEIRTARIAPDLPPFVDEAYDGLIRTGSGPILPNGDTTHRQVYPTDDRAFRPEPGQSFTYDTVYRTGGWFFGVESTDTTNLRVVGRDSVRIGPCTYATVVIEKIVVEGMRGIMGDQVPQPRLYRLQYAPDLQVVLSEDRATDSPTLPDSIAAD
jgi:hypothetical protein